MKTGLIETRSTNPTDVGPLYPFVGWEEVMFVVCLIAWLGWHVVQLRAEAEDLSEGAEKLKRSS